MKVCIVAGGTGGHIVPAIAVAEKIQGEKLFITGRLRKAEEKFSKQIPGEVKFIDVRPIVGKGLSAIIGFISVIPAVKQVLEIFKNFKPEVVIGFGGYVSGPVLLAGKLSGAKVFVFEQNSFMGFANKISSFFADKVLLSFPDAEIPSFARKKSVHVGFPIRDKFKAELSSAMSLGKNSESINIFVTGGSQGALSLNLLFLETLKKIISSSKEIRKIKVFHQTGDISYFLVKEFYEREIFPLANKKGFSFDVEIFSFTDRMGYFIGVADLVISRGGAGTVFEVAYAKKPAIFVPLPKSIGDHQFKNPLKLFRDACIIVRQEEKGRFEIIMSEILKKHTMLEEMKKRVEEEMKNIQIDGTEKIIDILKG
jgi:UDP-N-acetylglucosamine--N-acetylmuramyl-(pentapeptide) pyrophosphoryl-undecaprenol N-acetylglucosamine transferase